MRARRDGAGQSIREMDTRSARTPRGASLLPDRDTTDTYVLLPSAGRIDATRATSPRSVVSVRGYRCCAAKPDGVRQDEAISDSGQNRASVTGTAVSPNL